MSTTDMKKEIELKLLQIETRLLEAQGRLAAGNPHEKVEAVSELDFLRHQKQGLESRLAKLDDLLDGGMEHAARVVQGRSRDAGATPG
jgi:cob(I)alamin adenosyltransferase